MLNRFEKLLNNRYWIVMLIVSASVGTLYFAPFLHNFFVFDDYRYLENQLLGLKGILIGYNAFRLISNAAWYPLYQMFHFDTFGYNLFNMLLFILNGILVCLFVQKLFQRPALSLLSGTLFVMNSAIVDAVFWRMSLSTLMCAAFYLLALTSYVEYRRHGRTKYSVLAIGLFFCAMFTKEDAASFPFVIILLELLIFREKFDLLLLFRRALPYCAIIIFYLASSKTVFHLLGIKPEIERFFQIRPLYSLLAGYTVFFIRPSGLLDPANPLIYLTTLCGIIAAFLLVRERRFFAFSCLWIMATFVPQSLCRIGQFDPFYIFNSIGRLLFFPAVGASVAASLLILALMSKMPKPLAAAFLSILLGSYLVMGYGRVQYRGNEWRIEGKYMEAFLPALKKKLPQILPDTMIYIPDNPTGRAYVQQALRAYYREPTVTWSVDPFGPGMQRGKHFIWIFSNYYDEASFDPEVIILY